LNTDFGLIERQDHKIGTVWRAGGRGTCGRVSEEYEGKTTWLVRFIHTYKIE
jgi:hypothetical protein